MYIHISGSSNRHCMIRDCDNRTWSSMNYFIERAADSDIIGQGVYSILQCGVRMLRLKVDYHKKVTTRCDATQR